MASPAALSPAKGATVTAENPSASPSSFTAITDDKGRFSIIGMRSGQWTFTATMQGFAPESGKLNVQTIGSPNPPVPFTLKKGGGGGGGGALAGVNAKELQGELAAADQIYVVTNASNSAALAQDKRWHIVQLQPLAP